MRKKSLYFCVVLFYILGVCDSRRSGSGSRHSSPSYSRPSPSRPSYHSPSRPSYSSPSRPSYSSPSRPSYPSYSSPSRPSYSSPSYSSPSRPSYSSPSRPSYPSYSSPSHPSYSSPSYSSPSRPSHPSPSLSSPARPSAKPAGPNIGWQPAGPSVSKPGLRPSYPSYPSPSSNAKPAPKGPPLNSKPLHNSGKTHGSILTSQKNPTLGSAPQGPPKPSYTQGTFQGPPSYPPAYPGHGYPPPAYPGHGYPPPAYPGHGYPPPAYPGHYPPSHNTGSNVIINNNNIVHSPSPSWSYGYPSYHYHNSDTGSTSLGFYLGYTLGRVRNPTYYYSHNSYDGYRPRYDHYTVHHYYHNNNERIIERERIIEPNTVVGCVGDSGSICPANTRSLCTEQGVIMCVASISATVPCKDEKDTNCVTSTIPCVNSKDPRCKNNPQNATTVSIPCISTAKINGTVTYVNNTIIVENFNSSRPSRSVVDNATEYPTTTDAIPITTITNITQTTTPITTIDLMTTYPSPTTNITQSTTPTTTIPNSTTSVPITLSTTSQLTTTPLPEVKLKMTKHVKPQEPQNYCVTIMAVPNKRKPTKGEELFDQVENFVDNFLVKSFGL